MNVTGMKNTIIQNATKVLDNYEYGEIGAKLRNRCVLSIVIPTYSSPNEVKNNVKRLLKNKRDDIQILVLDNDDTGEQIKEYMMSIKDDRFRYVQNERNIGRSQNVAKAVEVAESDNVFLVSSDDTVFDKAIDKIISIISNNKHYGVIFGSLLLESGEQYYNFKDSVAKKGIDAFLAIPFQGNLVPFVVNRKCLDFNLIQNKEETYMQMRIALVAASRGDAIFTKTFFGKLKVYDFYSDDKKKWAEVTQVLGAGDAFTQSCDIGESYGDPTSRAKQFKGYIDIVEKSGISNKQIVKYLEKETCLYLKKAVRLVMASHDPISIKLHVAKNPMNYKEAILSFRDELLPFFEERKRNCLYDFVEKFNYLCNRELKKCKFAGEILEELEKTEDIVFIGNKAYLKRISTAFPLIDVSINGVEFSNGMYINKSKNHSLSSNVKKSSTILLSDDSNYMFLRLIPLYNLMKFKGYKKTYLMKDMALYVMAAWCSRAENANIMKPYGKYL